MATEEEFSKISRSIVADYVNYKLEAQGHQWTNCPTVTDAPKNLRMLMRERVDEFEERYAEQFKGLTDSLNINQENAFDTFHSVADEVFSNGISWGRIISLFSFGCSMAKQLASCMGCDGVIDSVVDWIAKYVDTNLRPWIMQHGGWCVGNLSRGFQRIYSTYRRMIRMLMAVALVLSVLRHTSPSARTKIKHGIDTIKKAIKLILWACGDIEQNPGPRNSRSEILRKFRKSQQSSILIMLYERHGNGSKAISLYKEKPDWWPCDVPFVNITNHQVENESRACFDTSIELLKSSSPNFPAEWLSILGHYQDFMNKKGDEQYLNLCKEKLIDWMNSKKIEKALQVSDSSSFMDDLRKKLKVLEDMVSQEEQIPADITDTISTIHLSLGKSKAKRKLTSMPMEEALSCPKRKKAVNDYQQQISADNSIPSSICATHQSAHVPQRTDLSLTFPAENAFSEGTISSEKPQNNPSHLSLSTREQSWIPNINNIINNHVDNKIAQGNDDFPTKSLTNIEMSLTNDSRDDVQSSLQLPSDMLNDILNGSALFDNETIDFDLDLLELSDEEINIAS